MVDAESTKAVGLTTSYFAKKGPLKPRIHNFCHYLHFSFTLEGNAPMIDATTLLGETRTRID